MRIRITVCLALFFAIGLQSQVLKDINTVEEARVFVVLNRDISAKVISVSFSKNNDSLSYYKNKIAKLEASGKGKLLESKAIVAMKVNYVYFDGSQITKQEIDKKRATVFNMHKKGISSDDIVRQFTMDSNIKDGGNFGWIDENDVNEIFASEVKKHKKGDVFTIDIPEENWYYVVFKLYDDKLKYLIQYIEILD